MKHPLPLKAGGLGEPHAYRSRLVIQAVKIISATPEPHGGSTLTLVDDFAPHTVPANVGLAGAVKPGDYLVILADGTQFVLPEAQFDAQYEAA